MLMKTFSSDTPIDPLGQESRMYNYFWPETRLVDVRLRQNVKVPVDAG